MTGLTLSTTAKRGAPDTVLRPMAMVMGVATDSDGGSKGIDGSWSRQSPEL